MKRIYFAFLAFLLPVLMAGQGSCLQFLGSSVYGEVGETVCIDVTARNFLNILGMQYSHQWDPSVLDFVEVQPSGNTSIQTFNFGTISADLGILTFSWVADDVINGETLPFETVLYSVCFEVVGGPGSVSTFKITDGPTVYEVSDATPPGAGYYTNLQQIQGTFHYGTTSVDLSIEAGCPFTQVCTNFNTNFSIDVNGGTPPYNYAWYDQQGQLVATVEDLEVDESGYYELTVTDTDGNIAAAGFMAPGIILSGFTMLADITDASCNNALDGAIELVFLGGDPPFSYAWSTNESTSAISNLAPGNYSVTVEDGNNCTQTATYTVSSTNNIQLSFSSLAPNCNQEDGSIEVVPFGGTPPYTYDWGIPGEIQPLLPLIGVGYYEVTVTDQNGCTAVEGFVLENLDLGAIIDINTDCDPLTGTSSITLAGIDASLTNHPYQYEWNDGFISIDDSSPSGQTTEVRTELPNGTYQVTVTDALGCLWVSPLIEVNCSVFGSECAALLMQEASGNVGEQLCADITVRGFEDFTGLQFAVHFDPAALDYVNASPAPAMGSTGTFQVQEGPSPGTVNIMWYSVDLNALDLADGSTVATLCWEVLETTPSVSQLRFSSGIVYPELVDDNLQALPLFCLGTRVELNQSSTSTWNLDGCSEPIDCNNGNDGGLTLSNNGSASSYTYTWSGPNGFTSALPSISGVSEPGIYEVLITNDLNEQVSAVYNLPQASQILVTGFVTHVDCSMPGGGSILASAIGGVAPYTFDWGSGIPLGPEIQDLEAGSYTVTVTDGQGCQAIQAFQVVTLSNPDCVWPGDTDTNKVVNHFDLLNIGLGMGETGPIRPNASLDWTPQQADDWLNSTPVTNTNYKHADTDGNGIIEDADTLAIQQNWGLIHNLTGDPDQKNDLPIVQNLGAVPLYVQPDTLIEGEAHSLPIILGESATPANGIYGIAFSLVYDPEVVVPGSVAISFDNSWLGDLSSDLLGIYRDFNNNSRVDIALTRKDGENMDGFGEIARLGIVIEDNIFFQQNLEKGGIMEIPFSIKNVRAINNEENLIPITPLETYSILKEVLTGLDSNPERIGLQLQPNPSHGNWQLTWNRDQLTVVQVYNIQGQLIWEQAQVVTDKLEIPAQRFPDGTYLVRCSNEEATYCIKAIKH